MRIRRILCIVAGLFCSFLALMVFIDGIVDGEAWEFLGRLAIIVFCAEVAVIFFRGLPRWSNWKTIFPIQFAFFLGVAIFYVMPPVYNHVVHQMMPVDMGSPAHMFAEIEFEGLAHEQLSTFSELALMAAGLSLVLMFLTKYFTREKPPHAVRPWSLAAIWGFGLVIGGLVGSTVFCAVFDLNVPPPVMKYVGVGGALLSLMGGVICILKRGTTRGIGFAVAGFAVFAAALGLAVSTVLLLENRDISRVIVLFFPIAFAAIAIVVLYMPYLLLRRDNEG